MGGGNHATDGLGLTIVGKGRGLDSQRRMRLMAHSTFGAGTCFAQCSDLATAHLRAHTLLMKPCGGCHLELNGTSCMRSACTATLHPPRCTSALDTLRSAFALAQQHAAIPLHNLHVHAKSSALPFCALYGSIPPEPRATAYVRFQAAPAAAPAAQGVLLPLARSAPAAGIRGRAGCSSCGRGMDGSCLAGGKAGQECVGSHTTQAGLCSRCPAPGRIGAASRLGAGSWGVSGAGRAAPRCATRPPPCPPEQRLQRLQVFGRGKQRLLVADGQARQPRSLQACGQMAERRLGGGANVAGREVASGGGQEVCCAR